ncbi:hypothetical protein [Sulfurospirillum oryzae]|uniref:hypothetical protein n=1 Tax=Sulfurospirillum oryzae TaxID=2976535 RepID=UPI0021E945C3|nr:hypothetical protein [Sulfurospirillum oryzae]
MEIKKITLFLIGLVSFLSGAISLYTFSDQKFTDIFGSTDDNIQITKMQLIPSSDFFKQKSDFYADTNIAITARNFGNKKIQITSYTLDIIGDKSLIGGNIALGKNILDEDAKKSNSIFIEAGEEVTFYLSKSLSLKKVMPFFETSSFQESIYSHYNKDFYLLHNVDITPKFNQYLLTTYHNATLNLRLFTGYNKLIKDHNVVIADGITMFENTGKFQHDVFLAKAYAIQKGDYDDSNRFK